MVSQQQQQQQQRRANYHDIHDNSIDGNEVSVLQPPSPSGGSQVPTMYDTSVSSNGGGGGRGGGGGGGGADSSATTSSSWSSRSGGLGAVGVSVVVGAGVVASTAHATAGADSAGRDGGRAFSSHPPYHYFPKSHPGGGQNRNFSSSTTTTRTTTMFSTRNSSPSMIPPPPPPPSHPRSLRPTTTDHRGTTPGTSGGHPLAAAKAGALRPPPVTFSHYRPDGNLDLGPIHMHSGTDQPPSSPDLHSCHRAHSEPIVLTEQDRFSAYVNRFARNKLYRASGAVASPPAFPAQEPPTPCTPGDSGNGNGGGSHQSFKARTGARDKNASTNDNQHKRQEDHQERSLTPKRSGGETVSSRHGGGHSSRNGIPLSGGVPHSPSSKNGSSFHTRRGAPSSYLRSMSSSPAAVTTSSTTLSTSCVSSIFQRSSTLGIQHPPTPPRSPGSGKTRAATVVELCRSSSDMGRTTSSTTTRRTRPSAARYLPSPFSTSTPGASSSPVSNPTSAVASHDDNNDHHDGVDNNDHCGDDTSARRTGSVRRQSKPPCVTSSPNGYNRSMSPPAQQPQQRDRAVATIGTITNRLNPDADDSDEGVSGGLNLTLPLPGEHHPYRPQRERNADKARMNAATSPPPESRWNGNNSTSGAPNSNDFQPQQQPQQREAVSRQSWSPYIRNPVTVDTQQGTTSAFVAVADSMSPGTNRTRDLAMRFEQRMHSKGRNSTLVKSAMNSVYNNASVSPSHLSASKLPSPGVMARSPDGQVVDEKKESDEVLATHHLKDTAGNIETPSPARVKELKQKLWDDNEYLQVRVRPTLPYQGEDCQRSPRYHHSPELKISYQQPIPRSEWNRVHRGFMDATPSSPTPGSPYGRKSQSKISAFRQTRSLSPKTMRKSSNPFNHQPCTSSEEISSSHQPWDSSEGNQDTRPPATASVELTGGGASDVGSTSAGSGGSGGRRFKSKFYEAAALSSPEWNSQSGLGTADDDPEDQPPLGATAVRPLSPYHLHPSHLSTWMKTKPNNTTNSDPETDLPYSQASTPKISNDYDVSLLLRKLHSINRDDPNKALAEIDEILKAEALKDDPTLQRAVRVTEEDYLANLKTPPVPLSPPAATGQTDGQSNDDESDSATTVSSITNPTYQGCTTTKHSETSETSLGIPTLAQSEETELDQGGVSKSVPSQQPTSETTESSFPSHHSPAASSAPQEVVDDSKAAVDRYSQSSRSGRTPLPPPPNTITTKDSPRPSPPQDSPDQRRVTHPDPSHGHVDKSTEGKIPLFQSKSEELAIKIRRWDELSGSNGSKNNKPAPHNGTAVEDQISNNTEDLGSIMTPKDQQLPTSPRALHLRDAVSATLLAIDVQSSEGTEALQSSEGSEALQISLPILPSKKRPERPVQRVSPVSAQNMMNLSNEFDNAWVALPTSRFFEPSSPEKEKSDPSIVPTRKSFKSSQSRDVKLTGPCDQNMYDYSQFVSDRGDETMEEISEVPENSTTAKPKRRLRALLQRGRGNDKSGQASASVATGSFAGSSSRLSSAQSENEESIPFIRNRSKGATGSIAGSSSRLSSAQSDNEESIPFIRNRNKGSSDNQQHQKEKHNPNTTNTHQRGRSSLGHKSVGNRSHSLEEGRIRNPNIARKFSRMLRVYGDDEKAYV